MNNYHVDITGIDEEVVYVDADAMVENITAGKIQNGGIKVTLRANQSLVFNVSLKDTVRIPEYKITVKMEVKHTRKWQSLLCGICLM